ncbi:MAG: tail fiber domain-containing protein [Verrucomicrobia bacterium]|nr:tail fiber domain-containing protein [Verrucomicrobiota bacterium]
MTQPGAHTGFQLDVDYTQGNVNDFTIYDNVNNAYPIYIDSTDQIGLSTVNPRFRLEVAGPLAVAGGAYPTTINGFALGWKIIQPGFGVAELVNYCGTGGGNAFDFFLVPNTGAPSTSNVIASINHAGVYTASDQRLKTGVQPLRYGLREVMDLRPKEYDLHLGKSIKDGVITLEQKADHQIGFLAQDVYRIVPEAVQKPKDPGNEIYKMNYSILVPVLVSAVQELKHLQDETVAQQQAKITQQETKIASLEAEVASLRQTNEKLAAMASKIENLEKAVNNIQVKESGKAQTFAINGNN